VNLSAAMSRDSSGVFASSPHARHHGRHVISGCDVQQQQQQQQQCGYRLMDRRSRLTAISVEITLFPAAHSPPPTSTTTTAVSPLYGAPQEANFSRDRTTAAFPGPWLLPQRLTTNHLCQLLLLLAVTARTTARRVF